MPLGLPIPEKIKKKYRHNESLVRVFAKFYRPYLKLYARIWTWWNYNRNFDAKIDPFRFLWIDPEDIEYRIESDSANFNEDFWRPRIKGGDWDKDTEVFDARDFFKAFEMHFEEGVEWEDTPLGDRNWPQRRFDTIDSIYESIDEEGYELQTDLRRPVNTKDIYALNKYMWEFNEIIVSIGRDGEILHEDGNHRLAIAKILNLDEIPVRVLVRHEKWQEKREKAVKNPEQLDQKHRFHPDIEYLI